MYCCTCAVLLPRDVPREKEKEKEKDGHSATLNDRRLPCCGRVVCSACLVQNSRFATYCPYCQVAQKQAAWSDEKQKKQTARDVLPPGLKLASVSREPREALPPGYSASTDAPPPYAPRDEPAAAKDEKEKEKSILHYLDHARDSIVSLSLAYGVPADTIRRANNLTADYLLQARHVVQIPGACTSVSLSPHPVEDEAETRRKAAVRRFMVACKVADYDVATVYLAQARGGDSGSDSDNNHYDVAAAVRAYEQDMAWERGHPVAAQTGKRTGGHGGLFRRW